jgi:Kef-type K+ transport system membrane component KefB
MTALLAGAACAAVLAFAALGRWVARRLGQPAVIGEIVVGLAAGPLLVLAAGGRRVLDGLPLDEIRLVGEVGLALYLVGVAYEVRPARAGLPPRVLSWVVAGALVPPLAAGLALAAGISAAGGPRLRGDSPAPAFVLMLAVALSITAVPVLARILDDRGLTTAPEGVLSLAAAIAIDAVGWLLLAVTLALAAGGTGRVLASALTIAVGITAAFAVRRALGSTSRDHGVGSTVALGVAALAAAFVTEHYGLTVVLGAVLVGLAVPHAPGWERPVRLVGRTGAFLVPVFFVVAGFHLLTGPLTAAGWLAVPVVLALAMSGKVFGSYAGARLARIPTRVAWRVGVLMNTRGLTELVVLQVGVEAKILTPTLYLPLLVMALVTTAATGPLLTALERPARSNLREDQAAPAGPAAGGSQ